MSPCLDWALHMVPEEPTCLSPHLRWPQMTSEPSLLCDFLNYWDSALHWLLQLFPSPPHSKQRAAHNRISIHTISWSDFQAQCWAKNSTRIQPDLNWFKSMRFLGVSVNVLSQWIILSAEKVVQFTWHKLCLPCSLHRYFWLKGRDRQTYRHLWHTDSLPNITTAIVGPGQR